MALLDEMTQLDEITWWIIIHHSDPV